jgi:hypothetical protein
LKHFISKYFVKKRGNQLIRAKLSSLHPKMISSKHNKLIQRALFILQPIRSYLEIKNSCQPISKNSEISNACG